MFREVTDDNQWSDSATFSHQLTEALKHAFADRAEWMGDPAFVDVPTSRLISRAYISELASRFDPTKTLSPDRYGTRRSSAQSAAPDDHGTSHLSIVDAAGNAVACTETINQGFGSCLAVDAFGFILNDQMDDFTTRRGKANGFKLTQSDRNLPAAGKRPLSSMSPTICVDGDGKVFLVAGASGGPRIITGTLQSMLNCIIWGEPAWEAVASPRLHHQWSPNVVLMEDGLFRKPRPNAADKSLVDQLQALGHRVERTDAVGNVQLIARDPHGGWQAACDPRKGGKPAGY
jgi:gamma-glutamyltranspeptidase/glutathione hydrolase